jgi:hypothetical protein
MKRIHLSGLAILIFLFTPVLFAAETLPLAGEWRFALDPTDAGTKENWFAKNLPDKIQLPGILESQGYGDEISTATPWVLSLYDRNWFLRQEYAAYTNAGNVKVPFLCQPVRHYLGAAWYQRDIEIPTNWNGKRVVLFLERPKWKSTVWVDDREIGSDISLCTPHEFELGVVVAQASRLRDSADKNKLTGGTPVPLSITPGKHRLTVRVDNRMILPYRPDSHSISDSLGQAWNGIVGKMELRATPPVWIEDVQVFPDWKKKTARVKIQIGNVTGATGSGTVEVVVQPERRSPTRHDPDDGEQRAGPEAGAPPKQRVTWTTNSGAAEIEISLGSVAKPWDEFNPALIELHTTLDAQAPVTCHSSLVTKLGLRDLRTDGTQFLLNGQPIFLRGTHFGGDFPLTGYPATDVESWKKIIQTCKDYGLNHMRFHSWCPPEAAFTAADELGFYLQVEPGMWNPFAPGSDITRQLYAETERIIKAYGNHPSLLLVSASNEAAGRWKQVLPEWVKHFRAADPRHLYTPDTGWSLIESPDEPLNGGADFLAVGRIGPNRVRGERGWFGGDYQSSIEGVKVPSVSHEVGQWCAYPDFDMIEKLTGFMRPGNYEIFRDSAAKHGVLEQNKQFAWASGRFQLACYKEEIEAALRTPGLGGFQLLDLHDYTGQGTALIGLLDPLWGNKGYVTPDEFKQFCYSVVPLARLKQRVFTTADKLEALVEIANFGATEMTNATAGWEATDASHKMGWGGNFAVMNIPIGKNISLGEIISGLLGLPAPAKYTLTVTVKSGETHFENVWDFWVYPATNPPAVLPVDGLETSSPGEAVKALGQGKKVLFTPRLADLSWWSPPLARVPIFWNALMGPTWSRMLGLWCDTNSPALAEFPTDANCDWQWTEIIGKSRAVNLDKLPRGLKPIVSAIDDWNRNYKLGVIFEAKVGKGKLLVCTADLNAAPVGPQLRRSLENYMAGDKFSPTTEITAAEFAGLFFDNLVMRKLGATATADGKPANEILDGDPNTFWCSADSRGNGPSHPHEIVISFPQSVAMNGLVLMPRQNHREHQGDMREYSLEASDDGTNWQRIVNVQLASTFDPQTIPFGKTVTAKQLKLTALSGFGADNAAALAELAVIHAGPALPENGDKLEYRRVRTASTDIDAGGDAPSPPAKNLPR